MKAIDKYFKDYDSFHRTKGNKVCHAIGIPLIVLGLFGLLDRVSIGDIEHLSPALFLWAAGNTFYMVLHPLLGLSMMVSTAALYVLGILIPVPALWALFALGWIFQGIGHYKYEHKSPAFMQNFVHLMIGPVYIQNYFLKIHR